MKLEPGKIYIGGKNQDQRKLIDFDRFEATVEVITGQNKGVILHLSRSSFTAWLRAGGK